MSYETHEVDLAEVLRNDPTPRARAISRQLPFFLSTHRLTPKISVAALRRQRSLRATPGNVGAADLLYLESLVAAAAMQAVGALSDEASTDFYNPEALEIEYVALQRFIQLPGALTSFDDNYRPSFRREDVYGRMDPIPTYQNTSRTLALEWEMNIASAAQPGRLLAAFQDLIKFMYPVYQDTTYNQLGTGTLVSPPVLRINMKNNSVGSYGIMDGQYGFGILCIVDNFSYSRFQASRSGGEINLKRVYGEHAATMQPTHLSIQLQLTVLHEEAKVGFVYNRNAEGDTVLQFGQGATYPYGYGTTLNLADAPTNQERYPNLAAQNAQLTSDVAAAQGAAADARNERDTAIRQRDRAEHEMFASQGGLASSIADGSHGFSLDFDSQGLWSKF